MPATLEQVRAAILQAVVETLASDAGPDGKPSAQAKKAARRIAALAEDRQAMAELAKEVDHA